MRSQALASSVLLSATVCLGLVASSPAAAGGYEAPQPHVVADEFGAPFNLELTRHGVLVADGFQGAVLRIDRKGEISPVVEGVPGASGVATSHRRHLLAYTSTDGDDTGTTAANLTIQGKHRPPVVADTLAYETANNPDQDIAYGIKNATDCQKETLESVGFPAEYTGAIDSHPYSVAAWESPRRTSWIVADAGANALLKVNHKGQVSTLAVLPNQPSVITAEAAATFGLDDCVVGARYRFESVPTDVEVGRNGFLYVTTLPGGPEDPSLGARGSVYKVNPWNGHSKRIAHGFLGATNLALGQHGTIYVTELFGGTISVVRHGKVRPFADLAGAVSIESSRRGHSLWAGTVDLAGGGPGTVVRFKDRH